MEEAFGVLLEVTVAVVDATAVGAAGGGPGKRAHEGPTILIHLILGVVVGVLSLLVAPNAVLGTPALRTANLVVAPFAAGFLSAAVAGALKFRSPPSTHFWRAFAFALTFGVMRFAYAGR